MRTFSPVPTINRSGVGAKRSRTIIFNDRGIDELGNTGGNDGQGKEQTA
jgi:hypothetical protein